jgi:UDP-N-acetylglucosamine--N-acetylmuramyl-(pentapeptide) pyrophosphoryl-undecaprenol N-acetylglucosamine transferase
VKILLCGGGTGGHVTPILAVAHQLKSLDPTCKIIYIGEHGGKFSGLARDSPYIDGTKTIFGGKFRRYHGQSWITRLFDVRTNLFNLRDVLYVLIGFIQSLFLCVGFNPDIIFIKGGLVGVPVGMAAALSHKPYITHDSDAIPSLTTKIIGKWAKVSATGLPANKSDYPGRKLEFVGVPVSKDYNHVSEQEKLRLRRELSIPESAKIILITGGSLGAQRLNKEISPVVQKLIKNFPSIFIIHQTGKSKESFYPAEDIDPSRLQVTEFIQGLYRYSGAADIVITRSGATSIAELALQGKACIVVPNPELTGGHQTKNANKLLETKAVEVVTEDELNNNPDVLYEQIVNLLKNDKLTRSLEENISKLGISDASLKIANLLINTSKKDK